MDTFHYLFISPKTVLSLIPSSTHFQLKSVFCSSSVQQRSYRKFQHHGQHTNTPLTHTPIIQAQCRYCVKDKELFSFLNWLKSDLLSLAYFKYCDPKKKKEWNVADKHSLQGIYLDRKYCRRGGVGTGKWMTGTQTSVSINVDIFCLFADGYIIGWLPFSKLIDPA